jgi:hypothetical protein
LQQPTDNGEDLVESFLISEDASATPPMRKSSDQGKNGLLQATSFVRDFCGDQDDIKQPLRQ